MKTHPARQTIARLIVVLAFAAANLACALNLGGSGGGPTATPTLAICNVPDLAGKTADEAEKAVKDLGLEFSKSEEFDSKAPAGQVVSQSPASGNVLTGCLGRVTVVISKGPNPNATATPSPTPRSTETPAASRTPLPSATPSGPSTSLRGGPYDLTHLLYSDNFSPRKDGFKSGWSVTIFSGNSTSSKDGFLEIQGEVSAIVGNSTWKNYRVSLRNIQIGYGLPAMVVNLRYLDADNYAQLSCAERLENFWTLDCSWKARVKGRDVDIPNAAITRVCQATCNLDIELRDDSFRLLSNKTQRSNVNISGLLGGKVGLGIQSPKSTFRLDDFEVYVIEPSGPGYTLFRDSFVNSFKDSSRSTSNVSDTITVDEALRWTVKSKNVVPALVWPEPRIATLDRFSVSVEGGIATGSRGAFGLLFRYLDNLNHYRFFISSTGRYRIDAVFGGQVTDYIDWTVSDAIQIGKVNLIEINGSADAYSFYINGKPVVENWKDRNLKGGTFGFTAVGFYDDEEVKVAFDNLEVYEPAP